MKKEQFKKPSKKAALYVTGSLLQWMNSRDFPIEDDGFLGKMMVQVNGWRRGTEFKTFLMVMLLLLPGEEQVTRSRGSRRNWFSFQTLRQQSKEPLTEPLHFNHLLFFMLITNNLTNRLILPTISEPNLVCSWSSPSFLVWHCFFMCFIESCIDTPPGFWNYFQ